MTEDVPVEGNIIPPIFVEGVKHAYGVDLADLATEQERRGSEYDRGYRAGWEAALAWALGNG